MKILLIVLALFAINACSNEGNETQSLTEVTGIWMDKGIQCTKDIENSTYKLDNLPNDVVSEIANYIDLEYGAPKYSKPVDVSKIEYIGEYPACNKKVKIWEYPCGQKNHCYVGIQPLKQAYLIGTVHPAFKLQ